MKNSVQYDSIITQENWNKKKVNAESVCKQKPLKLWYEKKLKSKKRINKQLKMEEIRDVLHFIFRIDTQEFKSFASLDEVCFSTFSYTLSIRFNEC